MRFYSTNKTSPSVSFREAVIKSLPEDKGLYFPEEVPELDFIELIIIRIGIAIAKATVIAFNKKIKYSNKISIIQIKRLTTVPVRQEASVAAKRALKAIHLLT